MDDRREQLRRELGGLADPPSYDALVARRAASRRRRGVAGVAGAAALVLVVAVGIGLLDRSDGDAGPVQPATSTPTAVDPVAPEEGSVLVVGSGDGGLLVLRETCVGDDPACPRTRQTFSVRGPDGAEVTKTLPGTAEVEAVLPDGWLLDVPSAGPDDRRVLVGDDGTTGRWTRSTEVVDVEPGDVAVDGGPRFRVYRPTTSTLHPARGPDGAAVGISCCHVAPSGDAVATTESAPFSIQHYDGERWSAAPAGSGLPRGSSMVAGNGDQVAVVWQAGTATGGVDDLSLRRSDDGGASFSPAIRLPDPDEGQGREFAVAAAVSDSGTVLVALSRTVVRVDPDGTLTDTGLRADSVFASGADFYTLRTDETGTRLRVSRDQGRTWADTAIPGAP